MTNILIPHKSLLVFAALLFTCSLSAQVTPEREKNDSIAAKYKNENAVYTNYTERLVITPGEYDSTLEANSYVTMQKLFISSHSPATCNTDFFTYSEFNPLTDMSGDTWIPDKKGGYKKTSAGSFGEGRPGDYVFYDDFRVVQAYYSGLCKNALTTTKYTQEHTNLNLLEPFYFISGTGLPILNATFEVTAPDYVKMRFVLKGMDTDRIKQTREEKNGNIIYRFTATNIKAGKSYSHVPSASYYIPHVIPYITSWQYPDAKKPVELTGDPATLYKHIYKYVQNLNIKEDTFINRKVAELTKNDTSPRDKATHIYQWVQKNIHYIAIENGLEGFRPREADTVCKRKYGDCKDMASTIVTMCRKAGLDAYFTWIGTNSKPYTFEEAPLMLSANHMICALKLDDKWVFLDGTDPMLPFGANRDDIQGKEALIAINQNTYKVVTVPIEPAEKNVTVDSTFMSINYTHVNGSVKLLYKGYPAWDIGMMMMYDKDKEREKAIRALTARGADNYRQLSYDLDAAKTGDKEVKVSADFNIDDYVQQVGKDYYVNMNLNHMFENDGIDDSERNAPYYFDYKQMTRQVVVLNIPEGYHLAHLPPDEHGSMNDLWNYKISYTTDKKANTITLSKEYELNTLSMGPQEFAMNNKVVDGLKKIYKETVVLTSK